MGAPAIPVRHGRALWRYGGAQAPLLRLLCFSHAGGGAFVYRKWPGRLPAEVELVSAELPGRGTRMSEPPARDVALAVDALMPDILALGAAPLALFGHSMGALLAFEAALRLQAHGQSPVCLFLAGCAAPERIAKRPAIRDLPDDRFVAELGRMGGIPGAVLDDPDLRRLALRVLRADMDLVETYRPPPQVRIGCDIVLFGGIADDAAAPADIGEWSGHAGAGLAVEIFPGGHFFVQSQEDALIDRILLHLGF